MNWSHRSTLALTVLLLLGACAGRAPREALPRPTGATFSTTVSLKRKTSWLT